MPTIRVAVPHQLSQDEALQRIQRAIAQAKSQNPDKIRDLKESWDGYVGAFSGKAMGYSATGHTHRKSARRGGRRQHPRFRVALQKHNRSKDSRHTRAAAGLNPA